MDKGFWLTGLPRTGVCVVMLKRRLGWELSEIVGDSWIWLVCWVVLRFVGSCRLSLGFVGGGGCWGLFSFVTDGHLLRCRWRGWVSTGGAEGERWGSPGAAGAAGWDGGGLGGGEGSSPWPVEGNDAGSVPPSHQPGGYMIGAFRLAKKYRTQNDHQNAQFT